MPTYSSHHAANTPPAVAHRRNSNISGGVGQPTVSPDSLISLCSAYLPCYTRPVWMSASDEASRGVVHATWEHDGNMRVTPRYMAVGDAVWRPGVARWNRSEERRVGKECRDGGS